MMIFFLSLFDVCFYETLENQTESPSFKTWLIYLKKWEEKRRKIWDRDKVFKLGIKKFVDIFDWCLKILNGNILEY